MKFLITSCFFLLFNVTNLVAQQQLGYELKVGDEFQLQQNSVQTIKQSITGMEIELVNDIQGDYIMRVKEVREDSYIIEFEFTRFVYSMGSETIGPILDVDTDREPVDDSDKIFQGLVNVPMQFEMLKTGRIIDMMGGEALVDSMINASGITDPVTISAMREGMEAEFGGQKVAAGFEQFTYIYPNAKKRVGDSWTNSLEGNLIADNTWTLDAVDSRGLVISGESDVEVKIDSNGTQISAKGTQSTQITSNPGHGFIVTFHSESTAVGNSYVQQLPDTPIPTTITTVTDYIIK